MAYSNRFVANVIVDGHIQKESNWNQYGSINIPFGSEYSLRFRNKHNRRAVVKFFIDGENVSGNGYVISASDYIDVERHFDKDRAFKFVELDSEDAYDAGKNGPDDGSKGLIEAHFYLEKTKPVLWQAVANDAYWPKLNNPHIPTCGIPPEIKCSTQAPYGSSRSLTSNTPEMQPGVTVEGNSTGQHFSSAYIEVERNYTTIKLLLKGHLEEEQVDLMQSVDAVYCTNCGTKRVMKANFCGHCGKKL